MLSQPRECLDFRVYQTRNSYEIDATRLFAYFEGQKPREPNAEYRWNVERGCAEIAFSFTQS